LPVLCLARPSAAARTYTGLGKKKKKKKKKKTKGQMSKTLGEKTASSLLLGSGGDGDGLAFH
jgi:hypothetical protein